MREQLSYGLSLILDDYDNMERALILFFGTLAVLCVIGFSA